MAEGDEAKIYSTDPNITLPNFPNVPILSLLAKTTPPAQGEGGLAAPNAPTHAAILMALVRLEKQTTDMVVSLNVPHVPGSVEAAAEEGGEEVDFESGKYGSAVEEGREALSEVLRTLKVKDWGLFGSGD